MTGTDAERVKQCLGQLDQNERYAVLMYFADELTPAEIGLVLDLPSREINRTLERFRGMMNEALANHGDQPEACPRRFVNRWLTTSRSALV